MKKLRLFLITTLIGGFLVLLPLAILVSIIRLLIQFIVSIISPVTKLVNLEIPEFLINMIVFAGVIAFCFLIGLFIRTQLGRTSFRYFEQKWLEKIPAYSTIRDIVQQFTGARKAPFQHVVLVDAFGTGALMTAFVTDEDEEFYTVFVPTAPNPTNGYVFHLRKEKVIELSARAEEAIRTVVGLGVGSLAMMARKGDDLSDLSPDSQSPPLT